MRGLVIILIAISILGCKKEGTNPNNCDNSPIQKIYPSQSLANDSFSSGIYILNEGTFTFGNASISYYDPQTNQLIQSVFEAANGRKIGDVLQSATVDGGNIWLSVNNSQKVEKVDLKTLKAEIIYAGFGSPRHTCIGPEGQIIVTELYSQGVRWVDTVSACVTRHEQTGGWTEFIEKLNGSIYVMIRKTLNDNSTNEGVWVFGEGSSQFLSTNGTPLAMTQSKGQIYLIVESTDSIYQVQTIQGQSVQVLGQLADSGIPSNLQPGFNNDLFFLQSGLWTYSNGTATKVFDKDGIWYGYAVDYARQEVYLFDAKDYVSRGMAYRLNSSYTVVASFETGVIPSKGIVF